MSEPILGLSGSGGEVASFVQVQPSVQPNVLVLPADVGTRTVPREQGLLAAASWQLVVKRAMDIVGSLVALILFSPFWLIIAVAIAATSSGPVLYHQRRVGRDGRPFTMYKFRSMYEGAHEERDNHRPMNEATGPVFKIRKDPRVTPVGRVLRRTSLDEFPQFVNVLLGRMSMVGPRPPLPEEWEQYGEREMGRLVVKPGITCTWQVSGRSDLDFETWVQLDLDYIRTWSLRRDAALILRTIPAVLLGKGAY